MRRRLVGVAAVVLMTCMPANAGMQFFLARGEQNVSGGEVCFYKPGAPTGQSPAALFFGGNDVRCYPAETPLDFPAGRFLFFGRHPDGMASIHRGLVQVPTPTSPECERRVGIPVRETGWLLLDGVRPLLAEGEYAGVWIGDTAETLGTFIPARMGEERLPVPIDVPVVPLVVSKGTVRLVGRPMTFKKGETREPALDLADGRGHVLAWVESDGRLDRPPGSPRPTRVPEIVLRASDGSSLTPIVDARHPGALSGGLLLFRDVPAGRASIRLSGEYWLEDEITFDVVAAQTVQPSRGLRTTSTGTIGLTLPGWFIDRAAAAANACHDDEGGALAVEVVRCLPEREECEVIARREVPEPRVSPVIRLGGIPPGDYVVRFEPATIGVTAKASVAALKETPVVIEPNGSVVTGKVTRGGKPMAARISFATMDSATSDADGRYTVILRQSPGTLPVRIDLCGEPTSAVFLPKEEPRPDRAYDIDIPDNALHVKVIDGSSGAPIRNAQIFYAPPFREDEPVLFRLGARADADGSAVFDSVYVDGAIVVCATASGYSRQCSDPFEMAATAVEKRQLTLVPEGARGRVVAPRPIERGRVYLLDAGGNVAADVMVGQDGVFSYDSRVPVAAAVIASASLPLTVVRPIAPPENGTELVIPLPAAPTREFTIRTAPASARKSARVGIAVAGTVIPTNALSLHQASRNEQAVLLGNRPMRVFDIAEVGPISVLLGPDPDDRTVPPDAVSRPEFVNAFPMHVLSAGERDVVFP